MQSRERIDRGQIRSGCRVTKLCGLDVTGTEDGPACCLRDVMKSSFQVTSGCLCYPVLQAAGRGIGGFSPCCFSFLFFFFNQNVKVIVSSELPFPCLNCDRESNKGIYPWMSLMIFPHTEEESSLLSGCCQMFPLSNERSLSINHSIAVSPAVARELGGGRYKASWEVCKANRRQDLSGLQECSTGFSHG